MSALIPALISLLMSRAKGGGGGGGGGDKLSDTEKDRRYWDKELYSPPWAKSIGNSAEAAAKSVRSRPLPSWDNVGNQ